MTRFALYEPQQGDGLLLDLQSDLFDTFGTRVVVPLLPVGTTPASIARLHPVFVVNGIKYVMATHLIATVPREVLTRQRGNLGEHRDRITAALDMLFQGF